MAWFITGVVVTLIVVYLIIPNRKAIWTWLKSLKGKKE